MLTLTIERDDVFDELKKLQGVVDRKNSIPVLDNVLIDIHDSGRGYYAELSVTNLEVGMLTQIDHVNATPGSITIPAQKLFEILRELPSGLMTLTVDDQSWVTLTAGSSSFRVAGLPKTDFPQLPNIDTTAQRVACHTAAFQKALATTLPAVSHDESRYALIGVLIDFTADAVTFAATDGHRLNVYTMPAADQRGQVIIPSRAAVKLKSLCETTDTLEMAFNGDRSVSFMFGNTRLDTRLIDAKFPDYQRVIPGSSTSTATFDAAHLKAAIRRVSLLNGDSGLLAFAFDGQTCSLFAQQAQVGEAHEDIPYTGTARDMQIGFNARYVQDALAVLDAERVTLSLKDSLSPGLWTADGSAARCVVMPMRV